MPIEIDRFDTVQVLLALHMETVVAVIVGNGVIIDHSLSRFKPVNECLCVDLTVPM